MKPTRNGKTGVKRGPLWRLDALSQLRRLFPEFLVMLVVGTCLGTVMVFGNDYDVSTALPMVFVTQFATLVILYACTYLGNDERLQNTGWLLAEMVIVAIGIHSPFRQSYSAIISSGMVILLFYLTRLRITFALLIVQIVALMPTVGEMPEIWAVHFIGIAALVTLFIMRNAATRTTMGLQMARPGTGEADGKDLPSTGHLGVYGQVIALAATVGALCLAITLAGLPLLGKVTSVIGSTTTGVTQEEQTTTARTDRDQTETDQAAPHADDTTTLDESPQSSDRPSPSASEQLDSPTYMLIGALVTLLVPAAIIAPFLTKLLRRRLARRSITREPRAADRAARVYLAIISRLQAVGIVRDETETPREFLGQHETDLNELGSLAGLGLDEWTLLTDVYEQVRYADLDPTEDELASCWQLYDGLPVCARRKLGFVNYLIGPFWKM